MSTNPIPSDTSNGFRNVFVVPILLSHEKRGRFAQVFAKRDAVPAKELRAILGNRMFYLFMREMNAFNQALAHAYPYAEPCFTVSHGRDRKTGRDVKIVRRSPHVRFLTAGEDWLFISNEASNAPN